MTDLSPQAQAVLIAEAKSRCLREERGCHPNDQDWNGCYVCVHRRGLAAALRAAADQCAEGATHWALYVIAAELEGVDG
jgi:hypothetical protein